MIKSSEKVKVQSLKLVLFLVFSFYFLVINCFSQEQITRSSQIKTHVIEGYHLKDNVIDSTKIKNGSVDYDDLSNAAHDSMSSTPDDITIEKASGVLRVKDGGISSTKLAGSIPDSKLSQITTSNKVDGAAITQASIDSFRFDASARTFIETHATTGSVTINNSPDDETIDQTGGGLLRVKPGATIDVDLADVTYRKASFVTTGKNLFKPTESTFGYYVNSAGNLSVNGNYSASDYIRIEPDKAYTWNAGRFAAYYDADKVFIAGSYLNGYLTDFSPDTSASNAAFVRFSWLHSATPDSSVIQFEQNSIPTTFEAYKAEIQYDVLSVDDSEIPEKKLSSYVASKNLYDPTQSVNDKYVSPTSGILTSNSSYFSSDYIAVIPNAFYSGTKIKYLAWFDIDKAFISGYTASSATWTKKSPSTAVYVRFSGAKSETDSAGIKFEKNTHASSFEPFGYRTLPLNRSYIDVKLQLPDTVWVPATDTTQLNIYWENVIIGRDYKNYTYYVSCSVGTWDYRGFHYTPVTAAAGNDYKLYLSINEKEYPFWQCGFDSTVISVVSGDLNSSLTALIIGNSLTDDNSTGIKYISELYRISSRSNDLTFIGTKDNSTNWANEGWSGYKYFNFCTAGYSSPFYQSTSNVFDIKQYLSDNTFSEPDIVIVSLGTNDVQVCKDYELNTYINGAFGWQDSVVTDILDSTNALIGLTLIIPPAYQENSVFNSTNPRDQIKRNFHEWNRRMLAKWGKGGTNENSRVSLIPLYVNLDTEYNIAATSQNVNARSSTTISIQSDYLHPNQSGYWQMADVFYGWIVAHQ